MDPGDDESASLEVGMRVKARYRGAKEYYGGKITRVNADGSCAITYDDGDREENVNPAFVRAAPKPAAKKPAAKKPAKRARKK